MADTFGGPTTDGIDDFGWTFNGTEAIPQAMAERVDYTSIWHPWLQPFVQRRTCRWPTHIRASLESGSTPV